MDVYMIISSVGLVLMLMLYFIKPYRELIGNIRFSKLVGEYDLKSDDFTNKDLFVFHLWLCIPILNVILCLLLLMLSSMYVFKYMYIKCLQIFYYNDYLEKEKYINDYLNICIIVVLSLIILPIVLVITTVENILKKLDKLED